jgi:hypothetical protein
MATSPALANALISVGAIGQEVARAVSLKPDPLASWSAAFDGGTFHRETILRLGDAESLDNIQPKPWCVWWSCRHGIRRAWCGVIVASVR